MAISRTTTPRGPSTLPATRRTTASSTGPTPAREPRTPFRLPTPPSPRSRSSSWSTDDGRTAWPTKRSSAGSWPTPMRRRPRTWTRTAAASWRGPSGGRSTTTGPSGREARSSTLGYTNRTVIHDPPACKPPPSSAAEPGRAPDRGSFRWPPASHVPVLERVQADWFIVVPFAGVLVGLFAALVVGLIGGLVAASYNRSPFGVQVVVEVPNQTS